MTNVQAAPVPATSSSAIISAKPGLHISKYGFSIHTENTNWSHYGDSKKSEHIIIEYRSPNKVSGVQPSLTLRVDDETPYKTLKTYMLHSLKEYSRFGFVTVKKTPIKINKQMAYLVDLVSPGSKRKLRQVVFFKNQNAVILTCRTHELHFSVAAKECNQIIRNFSWVDDETLPEDL